jgi:PAS domain S-box-containing protein
MSKKKQPIWSEFSRALSHKILWICAALGLLTAIGLLFYLRMFENRFLNLDHIYVAMGLVFIAFFMTGLASAIFGNYLEDRRRSQLSAEWIMHGNRLEDVQYKALLNAISDTIFELDEKGNVVYINRNYTKLTNFTSEDLIGQSFFDILLSEQRAENIKRYQRFTQRSLKPYRVKAHIEMRDGSYRMVEIAFRLLSEGASGQPHGIGTITDREGQKQAEVAVETAERKYRDIFENSISGIYQTTADGKFISVNPALAQILGYKDTADVLNSIHSIASQVYVRPEDRAFFKNKLDREGRVLGMETQMYKKDGTKIWLVENARAVKDPNGEILYYEGSLWDVTERRRTEEELKEAKLTAEITSRTKTEFLANMSHELRTPLNAIIGFSEIIKDEIMGPVENQAYKEYASDIYNSGNDLLRIISEILEVSKIEAGNRELNEGPVKLSRAVASCLVILKGKIEEQKLNITLDLPSDLPELIGEELVIKQILLNLVSNAVKFTPENGDLKIKAYIHNSNKLVLEVIDSGIGMSEEDLEKAMQPFWQANSSLARDTSGTGLGLTLVQSLARLHGANLQMESEKGKGTTVRLLFPEERILKSASDKAAQLN